MEKQRVVQLLVGGDWVQQARPHGKKVTASLPAVTIPFSSSAWLTSGCEASLRSVPARHGRGPGPGVSLVPGWEATNRGTHSGWGQGRKSSPPEEMEGCDRVRQKERMSGEGEGLQRCEATRREAWSKEEERREAALQNHCPLPPGGGPGAFSSFLSLPALG